MNYKNNTMCKDSIFTEEQLVLIRDTFGVDTN